MEEDTHPIFTRPSHVDGFDQQAELVLQLASRALRDVAGNDATMTTEGTPVMEQLADRYSADARKAQINTVAAKQGLIAGGLAGEGTYVDTDASVQVRMTVNGFEVLDIIDDMITEDYHQGAVVLSVTRMSEHDVGVGQTTGRVGAPMVGQEGPGRTPGSNNASTLPKGVGRVEVVATPVNYGTERIEAAELQPGRTNGCVRTLAATSCSTWTSPIPRWPSFATGPASFPLR